MIQLTDAAAQFSEKRGKLLEQLRAAPTGIAWCEDHTALVDDLLRSVHAGVQNDLPGAGGVALIAVGGYGRSEMAPYSDVDLLVVPFDDADPSLDDVLRRLHRDLHSALAKSGGVGLSYAFFLVNDAAALDPKTRTALLDARLISGSQLAYDTFLSAFRESLPTGEFLLEKINERDASQEKWNDTPLAVEPNLKEGAGGLRSHHCANWIRAVIGADPIPAGPPLEHVMRCRNLLHLLGGKMLRYRRCSACRFASSFP